MARSMTTHAHKPATFALLLLSALSIYLSDPKNSGNVNAWTATTLPRPANLHLTSTSILRLDALSIPRDELQDDSEDFDSNESGLDSSACIQRRNFLRRAMKTSSITAATAVLSTFAGDVKPGMAAGGDEELIDVYFGCGCFWHVQHEFVEAERKILGRSDSQITSRAGYAGGKAGSLGGKVCYHNAANIADYGKLGHAEVVSMRIPAKNFEDFAVEYCKLFDKDGFRPDQFGDRGPEYRNLVGLPGGKGSEYAELLVKASVATGDKLDFAVGRGDDRDLAKVSFIMDTSEFPFFVGEQYHQFHDGFNWGEDYPKSYNSLAAKFAKDGEDFGSCPNGLVGIGLGGL